jgi:energy-coupling factor transporter ATP-binding protein EcfA2
MKIAKLTIEKFRAIRFSEIEFSQETALVGQNSAGKSSILRALNAFFNFQKERQAFVEGRHAFQKTTTSILTIDFSEVPAGCTLARIAVGTDDVRIRLKFKKQALWQIFENGTWIAAPNNIQELCCNQVKMSVVPQSRNVPLGGDGAWLCSAETSNIAALNSHAGVVILQLSAQLPPVSFLLSGPALNSNLLCCADRWVRSVCVVCQRGVSWVALCPARS